ncbi:hypothetical protein Psta_0300 [Pirellula staleyi DSM 6068]|uniref:Replication-associated protein ORF2/G2P domain-containing protein n=1 Tax=Pirellula staleyi (strain ATCC 27377 / DSM 6068 / ICPB 4128) TaxID=530564 RepID=D2R282_PIRSD|nr:hypothetical protein Psta_0300 [Pirellula staleyi DSM 6068]
MSNRKQKTPIVPRQYGEFLVTEAIVERRKRSKRPESAKALPLFDAADGKQPETPWACERSKSERAEPAALPAAAGGGLLFQSNAQCCDKDPSESLPSVSSPTPTPSFDSFPPDPSVVYSLDEISRPLGTKLILRGCGCRKWHCADCGPSMGWRLQSKLIERVGHFKSVLGITLTVDGSLFESQELAWQYVMEERLLSRFRRELERLGYLHSKHYFWSMEFQKKTFQSHWHLLFDAKHVPYGVVVEIWSRFRPKWAPPLAEPITAENYQGKAPAFGSVWISPPGPAHKAAFYATKYLIKHPAEGYPDWVLDRVGRMPRFGHSNGFFPRPSNHDASCFCEECRGERAPSPVASKPRKPSSQPAARRREAKTIRERIAACKTTCSIVEVEQLQLPDGSVVDGKGRYGGKLEIPYAEVREYIGAENDKRSALEVDPYTLDELQAKARSSQDRQENPS